MNRPRRTASGKNPYQTRGGKPTPPLDMAQIWMRFRFFFMGGIILVILAIGFILLISRGASPVPVAPSPTFVASPASTATATVEVTKTLTSVPISIITSTVVPTAVKPNIEALQQQMLNLVNEERKAKGLSVLVVDSNAATQGTRHAKEMALYQYNSHWNLDGWGADIRYSLLGPGFEPVRENVYTLEMSGAAKPKSLEDWQKLINNAHKSFMNSEAHRATILAPTNTHVGIGIEYNEEKGYLAIAQEFLTRMIAVDGVSRTINAGQTVSVSGQTFGKAKNLSIKITYEPLPIRLTVDQLRISESFKPLSKDVESRLVKLGTNNQFQEPIALGKEGKGFYHIYLFADTEFGQIVVADLVIQVV